MSDRNDEISASHQASSAASAAIHDSLLRLEETQALLSEKNRKELQSREKSSLLDFFHDLIRSHKSKAANQPDPKGEDWSAHLREALAARRKAMAPTSPSMENGWSPGP